MHYRVIREALSTRPFVPFDVVMSSGDRYRVAHPENLTVLKDSVVIPIYDKPVNPSDAVGDGIVRASYPHIAALAPVGRRKLSQK